MFPNSQCTNILTCVKHQITEYWKRNIRTPTRLSSDPPLQPAASSESWMSVCAWRKRLTKSCGDMKRSPFFLTPAYCKEKNRCRHKDARWALETKQTKNKCHGKVLPFPKMAFNSAGSALRGRTACKTKSEHLWVQLYSTMPICILGCCSAGLQNVIFEYFQETKDENVSNNSQAKKKIKHYK